MSKVSDVYRQYAMMAWQNIWFNNLCTYKVKEKEKAEFITVMTGCM